MASRVRYTPNPGAFYRFWTSGQGGDWTRQVRREAVAGTRRAILFKPPPSGFAWPRTGGLIASLRDRQYGNQYGNGFAIGAGTGLSPDYALFVHRGTTGPIHANGKWMPVGRSQGFDPPLWWAQTVDGQPAYPYLIIGLNKALVRHGLSPVRGE